MCFNVQLSEEKTMCARSDEARIPEQTKYNKMKQGPFGNICGFLESDCSLKSKMCRPFM